MKYVVPIHFDLSEGPATKISMETCRGHILDLLDSMPNLWAQDADDDLRSRDDRTYIRLNKNAGESLTQKFRLKKPPSAPQGGGRDKARE